jgi:hypothetical protein
MTEINLVLAVMEECSWNSCITKNSIFAKDSKYPPPSNIPHQDDSSNDRDDSSNDRDDSSNDRDDVNPDDVDGFLCIPFGSKKRDSSPSVCIILKLIYIYILFRV